MRWCIDIQKGRKSCWHRNGQRFHGVFGAFLRIWIVGLDGELVSRTIFDIFVKDMSQTGILGAHQIDIDVEPVVLSVIPNWYPMASLMTEQLAFQVIRITLLVRSTVA